MKKIILLTFLVAILAITSYVLVKNDTNFTALNRGDKTIKDYKKEKAQLSSLDDSETNATKEAKNLSSSTADDSIKNLYGYWKINGNQGNGITAWSEEQFQKFIGQVLFFGPDKAKILTYCALSDCQSPKYSFSRENTVDYLYYGFKTTPDVAGIKTTTLDVIDLTCEDKNNMPGTGDGAVIFLIDEDTIIYVSEGLFFRLRKISGIDKKN